MTTPSTPSPDAAATPDDWRDMASAPKTGPVVDVALRLKDGRVTQGHWAADYSGEYQPVFDGWFEKRADNYFAEVFPVAWKPLSISPLSSSAPPKHEHSEPNRRGCCDSCGARLVAIPPRRLAGSSSAEPAPPCNNECEETFSARTHFCQLPHGHAGPHRDNHAEWPALPVLDEAPPTGTKGSPLSSSGRTPEPSEVRRTTERAKLETMIRYPKIRSLVDAAIWGNGSRKDLLDALHTIRRELP